MRTDGLEESLAFLRDILRTQRFEVRRQLSRECDDLMRMDLALLCALDIICRGSLALGEASQAYKVPCPHDLIPPFALSGVHRVHRRQSRRGIGGPPSGSCAAILFFLPPSCSIELTDDEMSRSLSGHIPIHRS